MAYYFCPICNGVPYTDSDGNPLSGGKIYTYDEGTTTQRATYADADGTLNTNPIVLDANGYAPNAIWLDDTGYRFIIKNSDDSVTYYDTDNITGYAPAVTWLSKPISTTVTVNNTIIDESYMGQFVVVDSVNPVNLILADANTAGFNCQVIRKGSGALTMTRQTSGTINGATSTVTVSTKWQVYQVVNYATGSASVVLLG